MSDSEVAVATEVGRAARWVVDGQLTWTKRTNSIVS
jgi:hypothetical protein